MSALVLVADADPFDLRLLSELCATLGYEVMTAADGGAVLDAMARQRPSLLLMDTALPVMDGFKVLQILKADAGLREVPVLLVTTEDDPESRQRGMALGADDYVTKPYRTFEIQQRLRNLLRLKAAREAASEAHERAFTDPLTNAGTANHLHISLEYEFTRAVRYKHSLSCVVVCCVDHANLVGSLGDDAALAVVTTIANVIKGGIRTVDHLFRSAEHEFTVLLPETDAAGASIVVSRLQGMLSDGALFSSPRPPRIAVAAASYPKDPVSDGDALWRAARRALETST